MMDERVKGQRERLVVTQAELSERSGVNAMTISRIERGLIARPYPSTIRKLAEALGIDPRWLRDGDGQGAGECRPSA